MYPYFAQKASVGFQKSPAVPRLLGLGYGLDTYNQVLSGPFFILPTRIPRHLLNENLLEVKMLLKPVFAVLSLILLLSCAKEKPTAPVTPEKQPINVSTAFGMWYDYRNISHIETFIDGVRTSQKDTTRQTVGINDSGTIYLYGNDSIHIYEFGGISPTCVHVSAQVLDLSFPPANIIDTSYYDTATGDYYASSFTEAYILSDEGYEIYTTYDKIGSTTTIEQHTNIDKKYTGQFPPSGWAQTYCH
ncbi:MAG: hypothetical protein V1913_18525 [Fibrobacterota bacterium]